MGKKNRKKKSNSSNSKAPLMIAAAAFLVMAGYLAIRSGGEESTGVENSSSAVVKTKPVKAERPVVHADLIETLPVQNPDYYTGMVAQVYRWVEEVPQAADALYCYCRCSDNPRLKHKTLLTCYTSGHASKCSICLKEGQMAWEMTQKGMTPKEIRIAVDDYYEKLKRSRL